MNNLKNSIARILIHWGCSLMIGKQPKYPSGGNTSGLSPNSPTRERKHVRMAIPVAIPYHEFKNAANSSDIMKSYLARGARSLVEELYNREMFDVFTAYDEISEEYHFIFYLNAERNTSKVGEPVVPLICKPEVLCK